MIAFLCSGCHKQLSAKEDLAGKKVKCRACGQLTVIPAPAAGPVPAPDSMPTLPPSPAAPSTGRGPKTLASPLAAAASPPTQGHSDAADATRGGGAPDPGHDSSLTDFLSPPQSDDELGRLGKYRILRVLGHGGMGVVFQAEDPKLKRLVALKAMLPAMAASASAGQRFLREAQAMAAVEHDHIVRIYQVDEERGVPFLAMEFLKGEPLDARLAREQRLPLPEVLRIGRETAKALNAAHTAGLIHRDIKPANVWLEAPEGRVKILDFGLARAAAQESGLTQQGAIIGTPSYMAPEQANGAAVDARSDLFSLGVVLYRLSAGKLPFKGTDTVSTLMSVVMDHPEPPCRLNADLPAGFSDLVMKLLEKDPARRPASAAEVVAALQELETKPIPKKAAGKRTATLTAAQARGAAAPVPGGRWRIPLIAAVVLLGALALGGGALALIFFRTAEGAYVIDTEDPDFVFAVGKDGGVTLEDHKTSHKYQMKVLKQKEGEYELEVAEPAADLAFQTKTFTIKRGEKVALKAWFERKSTADAGQLQDDAWLKAVAAMPVEKQVQAVMAKMKELNPGFDGDETHVVGKGGVVTELQFPTEKVTDISPVRALTGLLTLNCSGSRGQGRLADLSPLKDLRLTSLTCYRTKVSDLSPLKDMKLTMLECGETMASDLTPLKDMRLTKLQIQYTRVSDLTPLKDMHLTYLDFGSAPVADLSPLKNMKLTFLHFWSAPVADLSPLKGMELTDLVCGGSQVSDLSPLKDIKLTNLSCEGAHVSDLSPLKGMPLRSLVCDFKPERDAEILRSIKTLETINGKPAKEVLAGGGGPPARPVDDAWLKATAALPAEEQVQAVMAKLKELNPGFDGAETHFVGRPGVVTELQFLTAKVTDISPVRALTGLQTFNCSGEQGRLADLSPLKGMALTQLWFHGTAVSDLSPLKGMPLTSLFCQFTAVSDLSPLKGMPLTSLFCQGTAVSDLSPLKGMPLTVLECGGTAVSDLSPLKSMKLTHLEFSNTRVSDLSPLKDMKLTYLNGGYTRVSDLSPLKDMKLTTLFCQATRVTDLSPLKGMPLMLLHCDGTPISDLSPLKDAPLKELTCDFKPERDAKVLRSITTLETINGKPAKEFLAGAGSSTGRPVDDAWLKATAALPAEQQVQAVMARMKELNPGFDGAETHLVGQPGVVTELHFRTDKVADLSPVRALTGLQILTCGGSPGLLSDLSPLKDLKLTALECTNTQVSDLSPLKGMKLTMLGCPQTPVADLSPLKGMPLTSLNFSVTKVTDLAPLADMKLTALWAGGSQVSELSPLKGMPLRELYCDNTAASDLSPLRGMPLVILQCGGTQVTDLAPLKGMKLTSLECQCKVADLSPLKGMPLTSLNCAGSAVSDLSPLKDMRLTYLHCIGAPVNDLSPLKGMPLTWLECSDTSVSDLSPLKGMPLTGLVMERTKVSDLSPLQGIPLKVIACDYKPERDAEILRSIKTLETINGRPAKEFLAGGG